jgi:phage-related protein
VPWQVEFFQTRRGTSPPREFVFSLPAHDRNKVIDAIERLEEEGLAIGEPLVKMLAGYKLYELRAGAIRLFFFHHRFEHVVIVHGIRKKTQRTPRRDLDTADARRADYEERGE